MPGASVDCSNYAIQRSYCEFDASQITVLLKLFKVSYLEKQNEMGKNSIGTTSRNYMYHDMWHSETTEQFRTLAMSQLILFDDWDYVESSHYIEMALMIFSVFSST